ncbi:hypothetical protein BY458DRAFT_506232 [Sporodiniella umbellata]|nr:hypothetical protein BY458DRAFT_506232 [Sporodiniella umbellata]
MSRPALDLEKGSMYKKYKKSAMLPPINHLPLRKRLTMEVDHVIKAKEETNNQLSMNSKNASNATPAKKIYKTVVIQQKMTAGKVPCNPILWNSEDVEKNAPWIRVEESIESFKSAWLEGDNDEDEDEEERPTKKTAKRGRPPSNTRQPIEANQPDPPKRKNSGSSYKKANPVDSSLYCICRKPYDATRFMIACDVCDDWFHGECISIKEIESEFVDLYICHKCSKATNKCTSWKPKCSNPACSKAARISSNLGHLSKYCSSICGIQVARARLELLEIKKRNSTRAHLPSIPELTINKLRHSRINSCADKEDRDRLIQIQDEKKAIRVSVDVLRKKSRFVELLIQKRPFTEEDEEIPCGFDSRLVWTNKTWINISSVPTMDATMQINVESNEPFNICQRLKCIKHRQWQKISLTEIKREKKDNFERLLCLEKEKSQIKTHMRKRRCHTSLIKEYLINGNISI